MMYYKIPKKIIQDEKYSELKVESILAYSILLDLHEDCSIADLDGKRYVEISREDLKILLKIKGNQKIAQVMKQLSDFKLIEEKNQGLNKLNRIYILEL